MGHKADADHPDQGGSSFYVEGVHYFPNGFIAAADVNVTSNLAYRQVFSDSIQQAISPEERSQVFVNKDLNEYSFNFLARSQVTSLPNSRNTRIRIRDLPSVTIEKRATPLDFLKKLPVYFSFEAAAEGVSRKETVDDLTAFQTRGGRRSDRFAFASCSDSTIIRACSCRFIFLACRLQPRAGGRARFTQTQSIP